MVAIFKRAGADHPALRALRGMALTILCCVAQPAAASCPAGQPCPSTPVSVAETAPPKAGDVAAITLLKMQSGASFYHTAPVGPGKAGRPTAEHVEPRGPHEKSPDGH
jgi:hypothetical protein